MGVGATKWVWSTIVPILILEKLVPMQVPGDPGVGDSHCQEQAGAQQETPHLSGDIHLRQGALVGSP